MAEHDPGGLEVGDEVAICAIHYLHDVVAVTTVREVSSDGTVTLANRTQCERRMSGWRTRPAPPGRASKVRRARAGDAALEQASENLK